MLGREFPWTGPAELKECGTPVAGDLERRDLNEIQNSELGAQKTSFGEGLGRQVLGKL